MLSIVVMAMLVTTLCAFLLSSRFAAVHAEAAMQEKLDLELSSLSLAVGAALSAHRVAEIEPILQSYSRRQEIRQAGFRGRFGSLLSMDESPFVADAPDWFVRWYGLQDKMGSRTVSGGESGEVFLEIGAARTIQQVWDRVLQSLMLAGLGLMTAAAGFAMLFRDGMRSLSRLVDAGLALGSGNLAYRLPISGSPEFRAANASINTVANNLELLLGAVRLREANLNTALHSIGDAVLIADSQGRVTLLNPVAEQLTGWTEREARGLPVSTIFNIVNQQSRERVESPVEMVLREGVVVGLANHTMLISRDGSERPIADSGAPIRAHPEGVVEGVILVFRDQSEQYRMTEALRESAEFHSSLIQSAPLGIFRLNTKGDITYCSDRLASLVGLPADCFDRQRWLEATHPDDRERYVAELRQAIHDEKSFSLTVRLSHSLPHEIWVNLRCEPLHDSSGGLSGFVGTLLDVTAEHESRARIEHLSALYATLSSVNSAIVHCQDEKALFEMVCQAAVERGGFSIASVFRFDRTQNSFYLETLRGAHSNKILDALQGIRFDSVSDENATLVARALHSGQAQVSNDVSNDLRLSDRWRARCAEVNIVASVAIPITAFGQVVAVLSLNSAQRDFFNEEILGLADEISRDVSFAMENFERERERLLTAEKLIRHEKRLRMTLSVLDIGLKEYNLQTKKVWLDATAARLTGFGNEATEIDIATYLQHTYHEKSVEYVDDLSGDLKSGKLTWYNHERQFHLPDGSARWLRTRGGLADISSTGSGELAALSVMVDVTEQHQQADRERLAMSMFSNSHEAIAITDATRHVIMANQAFLDLTGYGHDEAIGLSIGILKSTRHDSVFYQSIRDALANEGYWQGEMWNRRKHGEVAPALVIATVLRDADGKIANYLYQFSDISQQKQFEERISHLAYRDSLTNLPNRVLLRDRVDQALAIAQRENEPLALLFLDLDHFKNVNDSLGHVIGDHLLREVALRLSVSIREADTVGRLGGDEFLLMLPAEDAESAAHVAQKMIEEVSQPFDIEGHKLALTPSIGIALFPRDGENFDELLKSADTAMYKAKEEGRNSYRFFTPEMNQAVFQRMVLESSLRRAIEMHEFVLFFQPQYDVPGRRLIGAEALIRWREPSLGFVSPGQFIPVAEESGLIEAIGAWVLDEACRQVRAWMDQGVPLLRVSVNFSARQFAAKNVIELFDRVLERHGLSGDALEIEITESLLAGDMAYTLGVLQLLRQRGIHVAIDDFGTGYSSLSYLKRFPINRLKIDQSFVRDIQIDPDDRAIATAIVTLGHSLGMQVIAEGVETAEQLEILKEMGCDEVQGYHLGHPIPAEKFTGLLGKKA